MFHSSGYFKKTLCPFHEHGLCHRPHCHYSHKLPKPPAPAKKPPFLKTAPTPKPVSVLNLDLSKIDDKVMSDVAMAIDQVSNFFGSSSGGTGNASKPAPVTEPADDSAIPSYAPEKCMEASSVSYLPPPPPTLSEPHPHHTPAKPKPLATPSPEKSQPGGSLAPPDCLPGVSHQQSGDTGPQLTEADVFGSPVDDYEEVDVASSDQEEEGVARGDSEVVMGSVEGPELTQLEAEFNKVTALPVSSSRSKDLPSLKRKAEDDPYGTMLRKKWKAHSDTQVVRESARAAPKPATINSNFSAMLSGSALYMGKVRTANTKDPKTAVCRPKLPLTVNARIPTSLRQKFLDAFIDEHLKMTSDPQQAYTMSLEEEKQLFEKSSKRMIYMNHSTSALKKLREQTNAFQEEQRARSDARVKGHSEQAKNKSVRTDSASKKTKSGKVRRVSSSAQVTRSGKVKDGVSSRSTESTGKKDWRGFEAELQDAFFSEEMKLFSKQFDSSPCGKRMEVPSTQVEQQANETTATPHRTSSSGGRSTDKCLKFYGHSSTSKPFSLEADLFGESSSDDEAEGGGVVTPTRSEVIEISDDQDPSVSFESALTNVDPGKATKKRKTIKKKRAKRVTMKRRVSKSRHIEDEDGTEVKGHEEHSVSTGTGTTGDQRARRSSANQLSKVPVLSLVRTVHVSSSDSGGSTRPPSTASLDSRQVTPTEDRAPLTSDPLASIPPGDDSVFDEIQPQEQVCLTTTKSSSQPLLSPTFAPSGPFINLTKLATTRKKPPSDVASIARSIGRKPGSKDKGKASVRPSITIIKKKEIQFTSAVFYQYMCNYVLTEEQLSDNGYPRPTGEVGVATIDRGDATPPVIERVGESAMRHRCCRCNKPFVVYRDGKYQSLDECFYHYGRLVKSREYGEGVVSMYTCCQGRRGSDGCQWAKLHVTSGELSSREGGYVTTSSGSLSNQCVYAVDCEMCYTTVGLQLTRVSVIDCDLSVVMERLVKPDHPIVDYNTRFSGLKAEDFASVTTTLSEVQHELLSLVAADTILVGHSLESDLRALKVIHDRVVDTALVFPHRKGLPYKRSLKALMTEHLSKFIQNDIDGGHDSLEDSRACMELMIWKVKGDLKKDSRRVSGSK